MAHIAGRTFVSIDRLFSIDETGSGLIASPPFRGITAPVPVGHLSDSDFRVYVGTTDGNIALFHGDGPGAPQLFHVTDRPVLWSLYHAAGVVYLGTGQFGASPPFGLFALDDQTLALKWLLSSEGPVAFPVGVAYDGNTPKQVIVSSIGPQPSLRGVDVNSGEPLWSVPDSMFGQRVHEGVVYYGNVGDSTLRARRASDGTLLWSFRNPRDFNFLLPVVAGGVVWASTAGGGVFALRASDGSLIWEVELGAHPGNPVVHFDHPRGLALVAVAEQNGGGPGFLQGIDANTGARLWTSTVPVSQAGQSCSDPIAIPFPHFPAAIEVGTFDGTLMSFDSLTGSLVWQRQITGGASIIAKPHWVPFVHF